VAVRGTEPLAVDASYGANEGFEYWFQRPTTVKATKANDNNNTEVGREIDHQNPLVIIGGGRETASSPFEFYQSDDGVVNPTVGATLRKFLPRVFPGRFEEGREPEMEWTGIMAYTKLQDPFVGPVFDKKKKPLRNQWMAAGYSGHGMPRAFACAEAVAGMIAAEITGEAWKTPDWLPAHYLTTNVDKYL